MFSLFWPFCTNEFHMNPPILLKRWKQYAEMDMTHPCNYALTTTPTHEFSERKQ